MTRYFSWGDETIYGELATERIMYMDLGKCGIDAAQGAYLDLPTMDRTPSRTKKGFYSPSGSSEYGMDLISLQYFLRYFGGAYTFTEGDNDEFNRHEIYQTTDRKLPSFSAFVGKDTFEHQFSGLNIDKLGISVSDGLCNCSFDVIGRKDFRDDLKEESEITRHEGYPLAFYEVNTYKDVEDLSPRITNWAFEGSNSGETKPGQGDMFPRKVRVNSAAPTLKIDMEFEDESLLQEYWGGPDMPTPKTDIFSLQSDFVDENGYSMNFKLPKCYLKSVPQTLEGSDAIQQSIEIGILNNVNTLTDGITKVKSPWVASILNETPSLVAI